VIRRAIDLAKVPDSSLAGMEKACGIFEELMPVLESDRKKYSEDDYQASARARIWRFIVYRFGTIHRE